MKATGHKILSNILSCYTVAGILLILIGILLFVTPIVPYIWYNLNEDATQDEAESLQGPLAQQPDNPNDPIEIPEPELPPFDPNLTTTNTLIIPSIGVNGTINEDTNSFQGLEKGLWRAPDWGTPDMDLSTIIAAHRFGYLRWSADFRKTQSFYNLPNTKVGDTVQIIWNQRLYEYKIYKEEDSTAITDYNADLILYTCRIFNSPVRVFRYAERVN